MKAWIEWAFTPQQALWCMALIVAIHMVGAATIEGPGWQATAMACVTAPIWILCAVRLIIMPTLPPGSSGSD